MFAPVVALVPTPEKGSCAPSVSFLEDRSANVANNVFALLVVGAIALVIAAALTAQNRTSRPAVVAFCLAAVIWLLTALVFALARHLFLNDAHYVAAALMFVCIVLVVCSNALGYKRKTEASSLRNRSLSSTSGETLTIEELLTLRARTENAGHVGHEHEWSLACG